MSSTNSLGFSRAGKCPPEGITVRRRPGARPGVGGGVGGRVRQHCRPGGLPLPRGGGDERIDLDALKAQAAEDTAGAIRYLVDMAKAEALAAMGQPEPAVELVGRHV